jgi:O-antigen ligase
VTSAAVTALIVLATLAFGAVYPWGYWPLFAIAGGIGVIGIVRQRGIPARLRGIAVALVVVGVAISAQMVPLPRSLLDALSPNTADLLSKYSLTFATSSGAHPISIDVRATLLALAGLVSLGLYLIGLPGLLSRRALRSLPRNLLLFAVPMACLGIYGREHNNLLVYGFWQPETGSNVNGFGPFVNRNHFAGWMLMATCLGIGVLCGRIEGALAGVPAAFRRRLIWLSTPEASRIILVAAGIMAMAISLVWTMSRSGIISFVAALGCFAWLMARRRAIGLAKRVIVVATLAVLLLASLNWRGIDGLASQFADTTDVVSRLGAWRDGWQVVRDLPIAGTGLNTYPVAMIFYQQNVAHLWMTHAHNDYLQLLAEGGLLVTIPAVVAALLLIGAVVRGTGDARENSYDYWVRAGAGVGLVAIAIQETVEFSLHIPANALLFATLAAVGIAPALTSRRGARQVSTVRLSPAPDTITAIRECPVSVDRGISPGARRPDGKARRPRIPRVFEAGATPPDPGVPAARFSARWGGGGVPRPGIMSRTTGTGH